MPRAKVQLAFMQNRNERKVTLKKRKKGLIKKVEELSTLCGVDACIVIQSPNTPEPDVWPAHPGVEQVIHRFRNMPDFEKAKYMEDHHSFAQQKFAKIDEELKNLQKENGLKELSIIMNNDLLNNRELMQNLSNDFLIYLNNYVLKPRMEEMQKRVAMLMQEPIASPQE